MTLNNEKIHQKYMAAAIRLARSHEGQTGTNPSVACVLVNDGVIVGCGVTAKGGRPHAEPFALQEAGPLAKGSTAYVTLEPCAHHGRTPPCAITLIEAGVSRVIGACTDPDHRVSGKGYDLLKQALITVDENLMPGQASRGLEAYLKNRRTNQPFVTLKLAMTKDGVIGSKGDGQLAITGPVSNAQTHLMRARHDVILVGSGTVVEDDPSLDCRLNGLATRSPARVVLDGSAVLSDGHRVVSSATNAKTIIVSDLASNSVWQNAMLENGCELMPAEIVDQKIALPELLDDLSAKGFSSVFVEGGASVAASFLNEGLVDAIELFVGPQNAPNELTDLVQSPITPETIPNGYELKQIMAFQNGEAEDKLHRYERVV